MIIKLCKSLRNDQSGRIAALGVVIIIMFIVTVFELSIIYADWNRINLIPLNISIINDLHLPVPGVGLTIDREFIGQTGLDGEIQALISESGEVHLNAKKNPFNDLDTTIFVGDDGINIILSMNRPYAILKIIASDESGVPLEGVGIALNKEEVGKTGKDGGLTIIETVRLLDSIDVKLSKAGYKDLSEDIYLTDFNHAGTFTMVKGATPSRSVKSTPSKPKPSFQSHFGLANSYLDRAIAGQPKYFGRALKEIDKAIGIRPKYLLAKQLKVEILFNFAKSLRDSNLTYEAANRLGEALKIYRNIPQDALYNEVDKLKMEMDKKLAK